MSVALVSFYLVNHLRTASIAGNIPGGTKTQARSTVTTLASTKPRKPVRFSIILRSVGCSE
jgi:hypothetical protein